MKIQLPEFFIPGHVNEVKSLIPVLGLPVLLVGVSGITTGLLMGGMLVLSLVTGSVIIASIRNCISGQLRHVVVVITSATLVSILYAGMQVFFYEATLETGIFLPLVAMNCLLVGWLQEYAFDGPVTGISLSALHTGVVVLLVCILFGAIRDCVDLSLVHHNGMVFFFTAFLLALNNFLVLRKSRETSAA